MGKQRFRGNRICPRFLPYTMLPRAWQRQPRKKLVDFRIPFPPTPLRRSSSPRCRVGEAFRRLRKGQGIGPFYTGTSKAKASYLFAADFCVRLLCMNRRRLVQSPRWGVPVSQTQTQPKSPGVSTREKKKGSSPGTSPPQSYDMLAGVVELDRLDTPVSDGLPNLLKEATARGMY